MLAGPITRSLKIFSGTIKTNCYFSVSLKCFCKEDFTSRTSFAPRPCHQFGKMSPKNEDAVSKLYCLYTWITPCLKLFVIFTSVVWTNIFAHFVLYLFNLTLILATKNILANTVEYEKEHIYEKFTLSTTALMNKWPITSWTNHSTIVGFVFYIYKIIPSISLSCSESGGSTFYSISIIWVYTLSPLRNCNFQECGFFSTFDL